MFFSMIPLISFTMYMVFFLFYSTKKNKKKTMKLLKFLALLALMKCSIWVLAGCPKSIINLSWFKSNLSSFSLSFYFDSFFILFLLVGLTVTWSMMEFSHYYMESDPKKQTFLNCLILFLLFMLMLTSSNNLFLLFMGWEGVGILSFVLMGWWKTRTEAKSSAIQAIMYNRMGDMGMLVFLALTIFYKKTWKLNEVLFFKKSKQLPALAIAGLILAAAGKSAQFGLHPWLPSAMEGPTPVSALLHSSTMVVAGVFLLMRTHNIMLTQPWAKATIAVLGSITALFAASVALYQFDIKKIMAYSTTSQLGLMMVSMGINLPQLAFFHMCTHAFFKSLLFLCSGSLMHSFKKEQDLRKMSKSPKSLPITSSCMMVGSLALCGLPFLAGYYSKDLILEAGQSSTSKTISLLFSLIATLMTAIYSFRLLKYINNKAPKKTPLTPSSEENYNLLKPLLRLMMGVLIAGWLGSTFLFKFSPFILPWLMKSTPLILTMYGSMIMFMSLQKSNLLKSPLTKLLYFLGKNWLFVKMTHSQLAFASSIASLQGVLRALDQGWTSKLGPTGVQSLLANNMKTLQKSFTAIITHYLTYLILIIIMLMTFTM